MPQDIFAYDVFISYKRGGSDEKCAEWLQKRLENYRIPSRLSDDSSREENRPKPGTTVKRKKDARFKVFRDKTDLGLHASLNESLKESLDKCRFLLVICSPRSAQSPYVDSEIRHFQLQGKSANIIPLILEDAPGASDQKQWYPPSLAEDVVGVVVERGRKEEAFVRVAARLLNVDFTELYQRYLRAQRKRAISLAGGAMAVLAVVASLAVWAVLAERNSEAQRKEAEGLVYFLAVSMGDEVTDHFPMELKKKVTGKISNYFAKWDPTTRKSMLSKAFLYARLSKQMVYDGNNVAAENLLKDAWSITEKILHGEPDNFSLLFFAVQVTQELSRLADSNGSDDFSKWSKISKVLAKKMIEIAPERKESKQALLGNLMVDALEVDNENFEIYSEYLEKLVSDFRFLYSTYPDDVEIKRYFTWHLALMCSKKMRLGKGDAVPVCEEVFSLANEMYRQYPNNISAQQTAFLSYFVCLQPSLFVQEEGICQLFDGMLLVGDNLLRTDPGNILWQAYVGSAEHSLGWMKRIRGERESAEPLIKRGYDRLTKATNEAPANKQVEDLMRYANMLREIFNPEQW